MFNDFEPRWDTDVTEDLRDKVDALTAAVAKLDTRSSLTEQHVRNHERMVSEFILRSDERLEAVNKRIEFGFSELRASNDAQTAILSKWGTIRDTLLWVCSVGVVLIGAAWAVFTWATSHLSK